MKLKKETKKEKSKRKRKEKRYKEEKQSNDCKKQVERESHLYESNWRKKKRTGKKKDRNEAKRKNANREGSDGGEKKFKEMEQKQITNTRKLNEISNLETKKKKDWKNVKRK